MVNQMEQKMEKNLIHWVRIRQIGKKIDRWIDTQGKRIYNRQSNGVENGEKPHTLGKPFDRQVDRQIDG